MRHFVSQSAHSLHMPGAFSFQIAVEQRLRGKQDKNYAQSLRASLFTENPIREDITLYCLLHEAEHIPTLTNQKGNNFRDQISRALLHAGNYDPYEHPGRPVKSNSLVRGSLANVMRARLDEFSLPEIEQWLMADRKPSRSDYFYRVLLHAAFERRGREPEHALGILGRATETIFNPKTAGRDGLRVGSLLRIHPLLLDKLVRAVASTREKRNQHLRESLALDIQLIKKAQQSCTRSNRSLLSAIEHIPSLAACIRNS